MEVFTSDVTNDVLPTTLTVNKWLFFFIIIVKLIVENTITASSVLKKITIILKLIFIQLIFKRQIQQLLVKSHIL